MLVTAYPYKNTDRWSIDFFTAENEEMSWVKARSLAFGYFNSIDDLEPEQFRFNVFSELRLQPTTPTKWVEEYRKSKNEF